MKTVIGQSILKRVIIGGLFVIPFIPLLVWGELFFPYITTKAFVWRIVVEMVFVAWVLLALSHKDYRPKKSYILYALLGFLLVIGLADVLGQAPLKSFWSNFERMEGYIALLHLGAYFLVIGSVFKERDWTRWWNTSLAVSGIISLLAFKDHFLLEISRVASVFGNPTYLAVYMLFHIFIAGFLLYRTWDEKSKRWVYGLLMMLQGAVIYYTATRGAVLGLFGGVLLLALLNVRNKDSKLTRQLSVVCITGVVVLAGGFMMIRNTSFVQNNFVLVRFASITTEELQGGGRSFVWPMAIKGIGEKPFLGWGQENFNYVFQKHYDPEMYRVEPWFDRAHNIFLDWAIAGGILGLISYLSLYVLAVYILWKRDETLSYIEKSILTSLVFAYFLHNLFVFDHLVSYILFFSLLGYIHHRNAGGIFYQQEIPQKIIDVVITPILVAGLVCSLYFINFRPMYTSTSVIEALKSMAGAGNGPEGAPEFFKKAYESSRLGRPEVVEQMSSNSVKILSSDLSINEKNDFFDFVKSAVSKQAEEYSEDAKYQILAGTFFSRTGQFEEAKFYLTRAQELIPNKQAVYFEQGVMFINIGDTTSALAEFKKAYDLAPENPESKVTYLVGAIYAGDRSLENRLMGEVGESVFVSDDRIFAAYYELKRFEDAINILELRIKLNPIETPRYEEYIKQLQGMNAQ